MSSNRSASQPYREAVFRGMNTRHNESVRNTTNNPFPALGTRTDREMVIAGREAQIASRRDERERDRLEAQRRRGESRNEERRRREEQLRREQATRDEERKRKEEQLRREQTTRDKERRRNEEGKIKHLSVTSLCGEEIEVEPTNTFGAIGGTREVKPIIKIDKTIINMIPGDRRPTMK